MAVNCSSLSKELAHMGTSSQQKCIHTEDTTLNLQHRGSAHLKANDETPQLTRQNMCSSHYTGNPFKSLILFGRLKHCLLQGCLDFNWNRVMSARLMAPQWMCPCFKQYSQKQNTLIAGASSYSKCFCFFYELSAFM